MENAFDRWAGAVCRHPRTVVIVCALATLGLGLYAATHLGVNADNRTALLSAEVPSEQRARRFEAVFGGLSDSLLVVIDGESATAAREAARRLVERLEAEPAYVRRVEAPAADPFFERHALLYLDPATLEEVADQLVALQPFLAELERSPDLATFARLLEWSLDPPPTAPDLSGTLPPVLDRFGASVVAAQAGRMLRISWEDLLVQGWSFGAPSRQTLVAEPVLEFDALLAAAPAIEAIRAAAHDLAIDEAHGFRVRITGYPALNTEEMQGLLMDVAVAGVATFVLVLGLLALAFRSGRLVLAAALTLGSGLVWTAAFAAASVGELNLVSLTFAVLFVGLGIDFAIHLGMHFAESVRGGRSHESALRHALREVGPALLLCTASTAVGFLSFFPTDYRGVAELGLISAAGMIVIFALTLTLMPALLIDGLRVRELGSEPHIPFEPARPWQRPGIVAGCAALAAAAGLSLVGGVHFDSNVVGLRNPDTESVRTWNDLVESGTASPWFADVLTPDLAAADALAAQLETLPEVDQALTARDLVPTEQEEKREILDDAALLLDATRAVDRMPEAPTQAQVAALARLRNLLAAEPLASARSPVGESARRLRGKLDDFLAEARTGSDPAPLVAALEAAVLSDFPAQMARLRDGLEPDPIALETLPASMRERMLAPDGTSRVQVFPKEDLEEPAALLAFVDAVRSVAPEATGLPVNAVAFGEATTDSLRQALTLALAAVSLLLVLVLRRVGEAALALAPLLLAGAWLVGAMALLDLPFNFANVIVLPLLLGTGVDSGIHLVTRARRPVAAGTSLAATTTGRAVFVSAATTLLSFGSLAFSSHRGIASLGILLVLGMSLMLIANLVVLPALLLLRQRLSGRWGALRRSTPRG